MTLPGTTRSNEPTIAEWDDEPGYGRSILTWLAVAFSTVMVGVTGGMILSGAALADSFGLGVFAATTGGTGFGVMLGGVMQANRLELALLQPLPLAPVPTVD